ncbi:MAG: type III-A CRISPR-associated RAMP protein Csm4 [Anaerolineae bacterium]
MQETLYHLRARSPFHLGGRGIGLEVTEEYLPSDTLFAAICLSMRTLYGNKRLEEFLAGFPKDGVSNTPPLLLSSAFPFATSPGAGEPVRFYPCPRCPARDTEAWVGDPDARKKAKKITWVSEMIFQAWVQGDPLAEHFKDENLFHDGKVWLTLEERERLSELVPGEGARLWTKAHATHVALDRASAASQVYQVGRLHFAPNGGLWFVVRWFDHMWQGQVETALHSLGDEGVGGERSSGHGQFELLKPGSLELPEPVGGRWLTLSGYHPPSPEETSQVIGESARYTLLARRGWLGSPAGVRGRSLRHKTVRMLGEGSILTGGQTGHFYGDLVTVTPERFDGTHPVYRYGLAFPVGFYQEVHHG